MNGTESSWSQRNSSSAVDLARVVPELVELGGQDAIVELEQLLEVLLPVGGGGIMAPPNLLQKSTKKK